MFPENAKLLMLFSEFGMLMLIKKLLAKAQSPSEMRELDKFKDAIMLSLNA